MKNKIIEFYGNREYIVTDTTGIVSSYVLCSLCGLIRPNNADNTSNLQYHIDRTHREKGRRSGPVADAGGELLMEVEWRDAPAKGVVLQAALAIEHSIAHALAVGQPGVKGLHKPARGLDQHAVAHGHDGGYAALQQLGSDGLGGVFRLGGLAGGLYRCAGPQGSFHGRAVGAECRHPPGPHSHRTAAARGQLYLPSRTALVFAGKGRLYDAGR